MITRSLFVLISFIALNLKSQVIITTMAGDGTQGYSGDGADATLCQLKYPLGVTMDSFGNIYVLDAGNHAIRKINAANVITTFTTSSTVYDPTAITCDKNNNLYVCGQNAQSVYKITPSGLTTRIAGKGDGVAAYTGDGVLANTTSLHYPYGVAVDTAGNVYIATTGDCRIRKVNTSGIISTFAGGNGTNHTGDGGLATAAQIASPRGLTFDRKGNLYIAEQGGFTVRKINTAGIISTFAGDGTIGTAPFGDGGPATSAQVRDPMGVMCDSIGNIYISAYHLIRKVDTLGIITTIAGTGVGGYSGDGGPPTSAALQWPWGTVIDKKGSLVIADWYNNRIRKLVNTVGIKEIDTESFISVSPNPANGNFTIRSAEKITGVKIMNMLGQVIYNAEVNDTVADLNIQVQGTYILYATTKKGVIRNKIIITE